MVTGNISSAQQAGTPAWLHFATRGGGRAQRGVPERASDRVRQGCDSAVDRVAEWLCLPRGRGEGRPPATVMLRVTGDNAAVVVQANGRQRAKREEHRRAFGVIQNAIAFLFKISNKN